jgi:hypothetical protein
MFFHAKTTHKHGFYGQKRLFVADILTCAGNNDVHSLPPQQHKAANCYKGIPELVGA